MKEGYSTISVDSEGAPLVDRAPVPAAEGVSRTKRVVLATLGLLLVAAGAAVAYTTTASSDAAAKVNSMTLPGNQPPPLGKAALPPGPPPPFPNVTTPPGANGNNDQRPPFPSPNNFAFPQTSPTPPFPSPNFTSNDPRAPLPLLNLTIPRPPGFSLPPPPNVPFPSAPNASRPQEERPPFPPPPNATIPGAPPPPLPLNPDELARAAGSPPIVLRAADKDLCVSVANASVSVAKCGQSKSLVFKYNSSARQLKSVECGSCVTYSASQTALHLESCGKTTAGQIFVPRLQANASVSFEDSTGKKCLSVESQATELRMADCDASLPSQRFQILPGGGPPKTRS